jgi:hypothetical protein
MPTRRLVNDKLNTRPNVALIGPAPAFFLGSYYKIQYSLNVR